MYIYTQYYDTLRPLGDGHFDHQHQHCPAGVIHYGLEVMVARIPFGQRWRLERGLGPGIGALRWLVGPTQNYFCF